ncbi:MAG: alpha/beta hydrolase [Vulcanimicrobiaceae bacterium]
MPVVSTPHLDVAYEERNAGARDVVVLVHGFPDDARTWDALCARPALANARMIAPWLRGFGETRFRDPAAPRVAPAHALARDVVDLLDALGIERCTLVGHDWGARAAYGAAVLAPERVSALVALSVGYGTNVPGQTMSYEQMHAYWYQWYFATPRGAATLADDRAAFCRHLWRVWSPTWTVPAGEYERTARAFENPDFTSIALHSYRHRWGFAEAGAGSAADEATLAALPPIAVPTLVVHGDVDGATLLEATADRERSFGQLYERLVLPGVGHFVQREAPDALDAAIVAFRARVGTSPA